MTAVTMISLVVVVVCLVVSQECLAFSNTIIVGSTRPTKTATATTTYHCRNNDAYIRPSPVRRSFVGLPLFAKKEENIKKKRPRNNTTKRMSSAAKAAASSSSSSSSSLSSGTPGKLIKLPTQKKSNTMVASIEMAQIMMDKRRHEDLKKELRSKYPFIPGDVIDFCMDITANAFTSIAPKELQHALTPGGFVKLRPELRTNIVTVALQQPFIQDIPILKDDDKRSILNTVVDMALDTMLQDAQDVLSEPEERLDAIRIQQENIYKIMGRKKLLLYRLKRYPLRILVGTSLVLLLLYELHREPVLLAVISSIQLAFMKCKVFFISLLTTSQTTYIGVKKQCIRFVKQTKFEIQSTWKSITRGATKHKRKIIKLTTTTARNKVRR